LPKTTKVNPSCYVFKEVTSIKHEINSKSFYSNKYIKDYFDLSIINKDQYTPTAINDYFSPTNDYRIYETSTYEESARPVQEYPSSADTFGNITGLLYSKRNDESTTEVYVPIDGTETKIHGENQTISETTNPNHWNGSWFR